MRIHNNMDDRMYPRALARAGIVSLYPVVFFLAAPFLAFCVLTFCLTFAFPYTSHAQALGGGGETNILLSPLFPQAGGQFRARVEAYSYNIGHANILWSVNGVVQKESAGQQDITLRAPLMGVPMKIDERVTEQSGAVQAASATLVPSTLDLVVEGDTRVPHFYRGRALPSPGSRVRLIALPSVYTAKGTLISADTLIYTWQINREVAGSGLGKQTLTTTMPPGGPLTVEVTVEAKDGSARYTAIEEISPTEPQNLFYEDNPLHGLAQNALPTEFTLTDDEISIRAEPYFVSPDIFTNATYAWTIDNAPIQNPNSDPQVLTLRKTGGTGSAEVGFSIRNLASLLQSASSAFTVYFQK